MAKNDNDAWAWLFGMVAIGGVMVAVDQHSKRKAEQEHNRQALEQLTATFLQREAQYRELQALLGPKNEQVRLLAQEVEYLQQCINSGREA